MYIILLLKILPMLYKVIKIRKKILNNLVLDAQNLTDEGFFVNSIYKDLFASTLLKTFDFLSYFKFRVLFFKNLCTIFITKSLVFEETRDIYKKNNVLIKVKKNLLNSI